MISTIKAAIVAVALLPTGDLPAHLQRPGYLDRVAHATSDAALLTGITWPTLVSLTRHESRFNERARSPVGARGLLQVLPRAWPKLSLRGPYEQIVSGASVFAHYRRKCWSLASTITAFRSGKCRAANEKTRQVLRTRAEILRRFGGEVSGVHRP